MVSRYRNVISMVYSKIFMYTMLLLMINVSSDTPWSELKFWICVCHRVIAVNEMYGAMLELEYRV